MAAPATPEIPGYTLLQLLGRGGMGEVFLARQEALGREVALKRMLTSRTDDRSRQRFLMEAEAMARVQHPNLIRIYDAGEDHGHLWIALERIRGAALDAILARRGPLGPQQAARVWLEVSGALQALHDEGLLHRDVKPGNVMIEDGGRVVLMDLGLARDTDRTALTQTGHLLGTPVYLSPELLTGREWVPSDDFYAVGISWWESLVGRRPFEWDAIVAALTKGQALQPPAPTSLRGPVPPEHVDLLQRLTGPRTRRPADLAAIHRVLDGDPEDVTEVLETVPAPSAAAPAELGGDGSGALENVAGHGGRRGWLALPLGAAGLLGAALLFRGAATVPAPPASPPDPERIVVRRTWHDGLSFVLEGEARRPEELRAWRHRAGRRAPAALFAGSGDGFVVWVAGLGADEHGRLEVERLGAAPGTSLGLEYPEGLPGANPEGRGFPSPLHRLRVRPDDAVMRRGVARLRTLVDVPELLRTEASLVEHVSEFQSFPTATWSHLLVWLEAPGTLAPNLMRALALAVPRLPPPVAWHLMHRLADDEAPVTRDHDTEVDLDPFEGVGVPEALFGRLWEWRELPGTGRGRYRLALRAATRLAQRPTGKPFPDRIPGWTGEDEGAPPGDPLERLGDDPLSQLVALALRARRGDGASRDRLLQAGRDGGAAGNYALALLPVTRDEALIPDLMARFGRAQGAELFALATALWGFRTVGGFFTARDQWLLTRGGFRDFAVLRVEAPEGVRVVQRQEVGEIYGWIPGRGVEVTAHGEGGRRQRLRMDATAPPRRIE